MRDMDVKLVTEVGKLVPAQTQNRSVENEEKETKTRRTKK